MKHNLKSTLILLGLIVTSSCTTTRAAQLQPLPADLLKKFSLIIPTIQQNITAVTKALATTTDAIASQKSTLSTTASNLSAAQKNFDDAQRNLALATKTLNQTMIKTQNMLTQTDSIIQQKELAVKQVNDIIQTLSTTTVNPPLTPNEQTTVGNFVSTLKNQSYALQDAIIGLTQTQKNLSLAIDQLKPLKN